MSELREPFEGDDHGDSGGGDEARAFAPLRSRPTPELDADRLWRRIEARLAPRGARGWLPGWFGARPGTRLAYAAAAMVVVALAVWMASMPADQHAGGDRLVLLTPPEPVPAEGAGNATPATASRMYLDVRLVRGFNGIPPDDVTAAATVGVGGADAIGDVRARIESLLPFDDFGIVGAWQGSVASGDRLDVSLADGYRLLAESAQTVEAPRAALRLDGIELDGARGPVGGDMTLEPGRLYIFGVPSAADDGFDLVLVLRAVPGEAR